MENSQSKFLLVLGLILIIFGLFYLFNLRKPVEAPYRVLTADSYDTGATVSLYRNTPPDFPEEVILENKILNYAGTVDLGEGRTQTKVSYKSVKDVSDILAMYEDGLALKGWTVTVNTKSANVATFTATKGRETLQVTIAVIKVGNKGALVTFQYDK